MNVTRYLFPLAIAALAGCSAPADVASTKPVDEPAAVEKPGLPIPEELVTDGLRIIGYPFNRRIVYEVTGYPLPESKAKQTLVPSVEKNAEGKTVLTFAYDGEPSDLPSETYVLEKDAIYGIAVAGNVIEPPVKAMPSTYKIGDTWTSKGTLQQKPPVTMDTVLKIVGQEKIKVPAGEYDAFVFIETGTFKISSSPAFKISGKGWYVPGIGPVKKTMTQTDSTGKTSNITIEAVTIE